MLDANIRSILMQVRDEAAEKDIQATLKLHHEKSHLMRIGNSSVSLNTSEDLLRLDVEVIDGRRKGTQTYLGAIGDADIVRGVLEAACEKARVASPKTYDPIPDRVEATVSEEPQFDIDLAEMDPSLKAGAYGEIIRKLGEKYNYSGSWSSGAMEVYLLTTADRNEAYHRGTDQLFSVVLKHPEAKWELIHQQTGWRMSDFSVDSTVEEIAGLLPVFENTEGFKPEPGEYTVIFGATAVSEMVGMAAWTGLNGRSWEEKQSWTARMSPGEMILGENISLVDDPGNPKTFMFGFDMSGRKRQMFPLVADGEMLNLMYDSATAARYGREPTGHDTGSPSLVMDTGFGPEDPLEAVKDMGRVLYIPALHYMNIPSRSKGIFTGSSRFNAVLVEDGEIVSPIFSSRVTDSFQNVLGNVSVISSAAESVNGSNTYGRRSPVAMSVPSYIVARDVKITDSADSF
ncbi:MAG: metallopeptidase TldD-related protein [Candidatus Aegiribacteria sp.]